MAPANDIEAFLAGLTGVQRRALEDLRRTIRAAAPDATESVSYGVPAFKYLGRPLVSYGAGKNHCALYVQSPEVMEAHAAELEGMPQGKGSIRFDPGRPLPADLVTKLVKARIAETERAARK